MLLKDHTPLPSLISSELNFYVHVPLAPLNRAGCTFDKKNDKNSKIIQNLSIYLLYIDFFWN